MIPLSSLIPAVLVLGLLILIHEFGHFLACRLSKVRVEKFSIGFGPEILHWQGGQTRYVISLLPFGGYVKPAGESVSEIEEAGGPKPGDYLAAALGNRIFIVISGVMMNYLLAYVLFVAVFMIGRPVPGTTVGKFIAGYPAETSGLHIGDKILRVNEKEVRTGIEFVSSLDKTPSGEVTLLVEREKSVLTLRVIPKEDRLKNPLGELVRVKRLGVVFHPAAKEFERYDLLGALTHAWKTEAELTVATHKAIFYLVLGRLSIKTISGPIGIVAMAGDAARLGLPYLLQLAAMLSVSLAVLNLLPVPALDGGHLFFLLVEAVRRKRVSLQAQERATQIGFILLLTFAAVVIYNDLLNIGAVEKIKSALVRQ